MMCSYPRFHGQPIPLVTLFSMPFTHLFTWRIPASDGRGRSHWKFLALLSNSSVKLTVPTAKNYFTPLLTIFNLKMQMLLVD